MVALGQKAVVHHLHRDGAEAFSHAERADVAHERAEKTTPIQAIVIVEAVVFGRYECLLDVLRDFPQIDVDPAHDRKATDESSELVDDPSTFTRVERADLGCG